MNSRRFGPKGVSQVPLWTCQVPSVTPLWAVRGFVGIGVGLFQRLDVGDGEIRVPKCQSARVPERQSATVPPDFAVTVTYRR